MPSRPYARSPADVSAVCQPPLLCMCTRPRDPTTPLYMRGWDASACSQSCALRNGTICTSHCRLARARANVQHAPKISITFWCGSMLFGTSEPGRVPVHDVPGLALRKH
ncbi:uncharacterized protein TRAVEDRAFT_25408 [Trametes versicolor FP-101664 SS1]|uniref:uncharacterized protein n=1 Tax=Trametes versicolor (strain FP-101664) TaxID=717944 RepID=UPI0004621D08|nr:uncharacterized protein TRAVEDRAFT_25408 [Trametes versicolor FP-101664 SS1]EIW64111.1 hypothetical protein TRAVEDRAFT_25408 [Trametes versicolor FP-101664 SS1]